jgi:MFS family permease
MTGVVPASAEARKTFAVCFAALVATSFCFILRAFSIGAWGTEFDLSQTQMGELAGVGLWPFAISIVLLSLIIDKIGFKATLWFAAACHLLGLVLILQANGYWSLYWGTFVLSLGNGAVEAGINPLIAREFRHDKTTWLNRLHAGWPAGFVLGGLLAMAFAQVAPDMGWRAKMGLILIPVITYIVMLLPRQFPASERVAAGVSYREMLAEAGYISAFVVAFMMVFELARVFGWSDGVKWGLIAALTIGYGLWSRSAGKPLFIVMILVMIPLAITELGTDSWITEILTPAMTDLGLNAGWVLVYAMTLVMVLRLFAGPIIHKFSPLGLLAISALVAAAGLLLLSVSASAAAIVLAATVYSFGKAFFWPNRWEWSPSNRRARRRHHAERRGWHRHAGCGRHWRTADRPSTRPPDGARCRGHDAQHRRSFSWRISRPIALASSVTYTAIDPSKRARSRVTESRSGCRRSRVKHDAAHHRRPAGDHVLVYPGPDPVVPAPRRVTSPSCSAEEVMGTFPDC